MGNGIAHVFAQYGFNVVLFDISAPALDKALVTIHKNFDRMIEKEKITEADKSNAISRLSTSTTLSEACILATNTSSISITKIAGVTNRPDKVIGMHFMNPVPVMKLVEVIRGYSTSDHVCHQIFSLAQRLYKVPVEVNDYPGFIANRILMPMINEAIYSLYEGVANVEEIDTIMKLGMAHPMGPLQLADFIGLDVCLAILKVIHDGFGNPKYAPCPLLINMVNSKKLGVKTKEGFYQYMDDPKMVIVSPKFKNS